MSLVKADRKSLFYKDKMTETEENPLKSSIFMFQAHVYDLVVLIRLF